MDPLIWIVLAVIAVAIVVALLMAARKKKAERDRVHAGELRERAAAQATDLQKREAHARETEAEAAAARAEAERKQAEAQRLAAEAEERRRAADVQHQEHQDHLRRADELDPDVNTRSDEYTGPDMSRTSTFNSNGHDGDRHDLVDGSHHEDGASATRSDTDTSHADASEEHRSGGSHRV